MLRLAILPAARAGGELLASGRPGQRRRGLEAGRDLRSPSFRLARRVSHGVVPLPNYLGSKTLEFRVLLCFCITFQETSCLLVMLRWITCF